MKKLMKAAGLGLVILTSSLFANAAEAAQKIGYVNTLQVFQALPQREATLQKLQNEFKDKAAELQAIQADAAKKMEKLQRDGELLGKDEIEKLRIEIGQLDSKYKIKGQALEKRASVVKRKKSRNCLRPSKKQLKK